MKWIWGIVSLLIIAIMVVVGVIVSNSINQQQAELEILQQAEEFNGVTIIEPLIVAQDFTLLNTQGQPFGLAQLKGKPTLFTFGFTNCPDICPTTLNTFRRIRQTLGAGGDQINFVFISVDGKRDTPEVLLSKLQQLSVDDFVIGLTESPEIVREMGQLYGLDFIYDEADENGNYSVDHTASYFLLDADGNWIRQYAFGLDRTLVENDLQGLQ